MKDRLSEKQLCAYAQRLLARRDHSREELRRKLIARASGAECVELILDLFESKGWLDDYRYGESLCRYSLERGYGPKYIKQLWQQKGIHPHDCFRQQRQQLFDEFSNLPEMAAVLEEDAAQYSNLAKLLDSYALDYWIERACSVLSDYVRKNCSDLDAGDAKLRRRAIALLQRRGFPEASVYAAVAKVIG